MAQYREYTTNVRISDTDAIITSTFGSTQISNTVARDGSFDTNFKAKHAAHRDAFLSLAPSSTSPPCYVSTLNKWLKSMASGTVVSDNATVKVPTGNSGVLVVHLDPTGYTVKYSLAGGAFTTVVDGGTITVTDGQTLKFEALAVASQDFVNGSVTDQDTGVLLDAISLMNSTP